jgi:signal transduction histidine kinase
MPPVWEGGLAGVFYIRLVALTAGTLVYLLLLALILGHRRPRHFERLLFLVNFAVFLVYAGGLLEVNASVAYSSPPRGTILFARFLVIAGSLFLIPLIMHAASMYQVQIRLVRPTRSGWTIVFVMYLVILVGINLFIFAGVGAHITFAEYIAIGSDLSVVTLVCAAATAGGLAGVMLRNSKDRTEKSFLVSLAVVSSILSVTLFAAEYTSDAGQGLSATLLAASAALGVLPGAVLLYYAVRRNFLEYGAQRNLMYALPVTFLALLYLSLVHRVGTWLEPVVPPEATASVLLFVLIFLFEPLERVIGPALQKRFQERMSGVQALSLALQQDARQGDVGRVIADAERRIRVEYGLAAVRISVPADVSAAPLTSPGGLGHVVQLPLVKGAEKIGMLEAASTGAFLTGETSASLQLLADQLPGMIDLSRLIDEKVQLERELAERERLASLGQMAASVSHNLRNPLSSMKTVLQVQLENPELPVDLRRDCAIVVNEIDRMSAKLTQLLRYAKPSVNGERVAAVTLARQTAVLFRHDAERRNVRLEFEQPSKEVYALASEDSLSEVLSNLIVNAIEAQPNGGRVKVSLAERGERLEIVVEDDGPGISLELRAKIFQPYFTTKPTGTGLGLSIVARRVDEMGGTLACESPERNEKGARFRLSLPVALDVAGDGSGAKVN